MFQGKSGRPFSLRIVLVTFVYMSSEFIRRPSMSKMQARTGGKEGGEVIIAVVTRGGTG